MGCSPIHAVNKCPEYDYINIVLKKKVTLKLSSEKEHVNKIKEINIRVSMLSGVLSIKVWKPHSWYT